MNYPCKTLDTSKSSTQALYASIWLLLNLLDQASIEALRPPLLQAPQCRHCVMEFVGSAASTPVDTGFVVCM